MTINEEVVGTVTILTFLGKMTLGEGDELLKDCLNRMLEAGRRQFVFDVGGVPYIDSAGNGEFVRSFTTISRQGGHMVLCRLTTRIKDLWSINKLLTVYETYDTVDEAVRSFTSSRLEVSCPICRPEAWMPYFGGWRFVTCSVCDGIFRPQTQGKANEPRVRDELTSDAGQPATVSQIWWPTYTGGKEFARLTLGRPTMLTVAGRLDRFVLDVAEMAWRAVPSPRRVLFDLTQVGTSSELARRQLEEICQSREEGSKATILLRDSDAHLWQVATVHADREQALAGLADGDPEPTFVVTIRKR